MGYFAISQDNSLNNIVKFKIPSPNPLQRRIEITKEDVAGVEGVFRFDVRSDPDNIYPDILDEPTFLVSNRVSKVFQYYFESEDFRPAMLMDVSNKQHRLYWLPLLKQIECLHETTVFNKDKTTQKMVLRKEQVNKQKIFRVDGTMDKTVVIHLDIAESLLRRGCMGISLTPVQCL